MKTLEEIRGRCVVTEDGHWLWRGALRADGRACIWAPDFTRGGMQTQAGPRAVWHAHTGKPIPPHWRVYGTCGEQTCCNPAHVKCSSETDYGKWLTSVGLFKGKTRRILANRAIGRARSKLTPELIQEIQSSTETGVALSLRLGLRTTLISRVKRGETKAHQAVGSGMFSQLIREVAHA